MARDTLTNYVYPRLVGGPSDGQEIPKEKRNVRAKLIVVGDETYHRKVSTLWGGVRVAYFLADDWDSTLYASSTVARRIWASHPDLKEVAYHDLFRGVDA